MSWRQADVLGAGKARGRVDPVLMGVGRDPCVGADKE